MRIGIGGRIRVAGGIAFVVHLLGAHLSGAGSLGVIGMSLPDDYQRPIWRCYMNGTGVGALALDPREAEFVLERGWAVLDGKRYRVSLEGWDGKPAGSTLRWVFPWIPGAGFMWPTPATIEFRLCTRRMDR